MKKRHSMEAIKIIIGIFAVCFGCGTILGLTAHIGNYFYNKREEKKDIRFKNHQEFLNWYKNLRRN